MCKGNRFSHNPLLESSIFHIIRLRIALIFTFSYLFSGCNFTFHRFPVLKLRKSKEIGNPRLCSRNL